MSPRRCMVSLAIVAILALAAGILQAKPGGGMRSGFSRPSANNNNNNKPAQTTDPKKLQDAIDKKVAKFDADGFAALLAGDTATAFEVFSDALALNPLAPEAHLGMGLTRAAQGNYPASQTELESAMRLKANPRLTLYDLAIANVRQKNVGRAAVILNRHLVETKPTDELILNAQLDLLSTLDDAQKRQIAQLPEFLKTLSNMNQSFGSSKYPGLVRWGLAWVSMDESQRVHASGQKEPFPAKLPFLLPGDLPLPENGQVIAANVLFPNGVAVAAKPNANPQAADPDAKAGAGQANGPLKLGGSASSDDPPAEKPAVVGVDPTPAIKPSAPSPVTHTVRGAAFAVAPDLLLTASRLVVNSKEIQLQDEQGKRIDATVVAIDAQAGVALLRAAGASFKPMGLADAAKPGPVAVAAFVKPTVFNPDLDVINGQLIGEHDKLTLRCGTHPRSAGSPFFDDQGRVLGLLTAARDDAADHLPIATVEAIRKFAEGKFTPAATTTATHPAESVLEMTVIRQD